MADAERAGVAERCKSTYAVTMTQPDALTADLFAGRRSSWKQNLDRLDRSRRGQRRRAAEGSCAWEKPPVLPAGTPRRRARPHAPAAPAGPRLHPELDEPFLTQADRMVPTPSPAALQPLDGSERRATAAIEAPAAAWLERHDAVTPRTAKEPLRNRLALLLSRSAHVQFHTGQIRLVVKPA